MVWSHVGGVLFLIFQGMSTLESLVPEVNSLSISELWFTLWHKRHSDSCRPSFKPQQGTDSISPQPELTQMAILVLLFSQPPFTLHRFNSSWRTDCSSEVDAMRIRNYTLLNLLFSINSLGHVSSKNWIMQRKEVRSCIKYIVS